MRSIEPGYEKRVDCLDDACVSSWIQLITDFDMNPNTFTQIDDEINDVFDELQISQKTSTFSRSNQEKNSFIQGISSLPNQFK